MVSLDALKEAISQQPLYYTVHAQEQMALRRILDKEIREIMTEKSAEIIEQYPEDKYSPSCLIYGKTKNNRVLHVQANEQGLIITVYEPERAKWNTDLKTRRS